MVGKKLNPLFQQIQSKRSEFSYFSTHVAYGEILPTRKKKSRIPISWIEFKKFEIFPILSNSLLHFSTFSGKFQRLVYIKLIMIQCTHRKATVEELFSDGRLIKSWRFYVRNTFFGVITRPWRNKIKY